MRVWRSEKTCGHQQRKDHRNPCPPYPDRHRLTSLPRAFAFYACAVAISGDHPSWLLARSAGSITRFVLTCNDSLLLY
jgi:hypothetical protein